MPTLTHLKSSLDRFIVTYTHNFSRYKVNLKSSLDRFIDRQIFSSERKIIDLKSSLDRFIADEYTSVPLRNEKFKIQFG